MPYKNKEQQREYQRQWKASKKAAWFADKSCVACGATENLELDHVDQATKITHKIWTWSEEKRNTELAKCQVLCELCHVKKTTLSGDNPSTKFSEEDVRHIRNLVSQGISQRSIAKQYEVSSNTINLMVRGLTWNWVE